MVVIEDELADDEIVFEYEDVENVAKKEIDAKFSKLIKDVEVEKRVTEISSGAEATDLLPTKKDKLD